MMLATHVMRGGDVCSGRRGPPSGWRVGGNPLLPALVPSSYPLQTSFIHVYAIILGPAACERLDTSSTCVSLVFLGIPNRYTHKADTTHIPRARASVFGSLHHIISTGDEGGASRGICITSEAAGEMVRLVYTTAGSEECARATEREESRQCESGVATP